jgi:hypothetical protein
MGILDAPGYSRVASDTKFAQFQSTFDVIVIGATEVGVMSAVAAARHGCTVLLVGQNERVGGNVGYGITMQDIITAVSPQLVTGVTREFFSRVSKQNFGLPNEFGRWWRSGGPTKPTWSKRAFSEMIAAERNITVLLSQTLDAVTKSGTTITSVTLSGRQYFGTVIIDATPTGDVAQKAGCTVSIGREGNTLYSETSAGVMTPVAIGAGGTVDPYVTPGVSGSGLLPGVSPRALGTVNAADGGVMVAGWRLFLTSVPAEMIAWPLTPPTGYNAQNYELLARMWASNAAFYNATDGSYPSAPGKALSRSFQIYATLFAFGTGGNGVDATATYMDLNSSILTSHYPNAEENLEYVTATPARRAVIESNATKYLKGLFYFITQSGDSRVPANLKTAINTYGLSSVELPEYGGWNPNFYIREGARVVGDYVMKTSDIGVNNGVTDAIGWWCYDFDSHQVRVVDVGGVAKSEGGIGVSATLSQYGSPVSMKTLFPKVAECTNLLCPGQPSVSRFVYVALRATITMMILGEGAGYVAADAVRNKTTVQAVNVARVKNMQDLAGLAKCYTAANAAITFGLGTGMTVSESGSGTPFATIASNFRWGPHIAASPGAAGAVAMQSVAAGVVRQKRFIPNVYRPGRYRVVHFYPPSGNAAADASAFRASNVTYSITHADGTTTRVISQVWPGPGVGADVLGEFYFPYNVSGTTAGGYVDVNTSGATTDGLVVVGIIALFPLDDTTMAVNV